MPRLIWVDALRGIAILLMIIFHFSYDLRYFGYVDWDVPNGSNWRPFRYVIISLFVFTVGVSLSLAHGRGVRWRSFGVRVAQLCLASLGITIMSLYMFPNAWIYFGILHFITFASLVGIFLVRFPIFALALGALVLMGYWLDLLQSYWPYSLFAEWLPKYTEDFVPIFPWLGVVCLGVGFAGLFPVSKIDIPRSVFSERLAFLGKHGLLIYIAHQPVLFAGFFAVRYLLGA